MVFFDLIIIITRSCDITVHRAGSQLKIINFGLFSPISCHFPSTYAPQEPLMRSVGVSQSVLRCHDTSMVTRINVELEKYKGKNKIFRG